VIVLDLEWNQPFGGRRMEEIIQIGAVRLARPGGPVVDAFNAHIRPSIYRKLSPVAKKLPESAQALTSELDFPTAYQAFLDWCGEDTLWAEWGAQDHGVLAANAAYWKLPAPPVTACIDLQAAFCRTLEIGLGRRIALEQAAEYCGLPLIYEFHNALHDALYAALITAWLTESSLLPTAPRTEAKHKRRRGVKFSRETYPKQPRQKITPLPEREQLLNSRQARIVPCPLCRQQLDVPAQPVEQLDGRRLIQHIPAAPLENGQLGIGRHLAGRRQAAVLSPRTPGDQGYLPPVRRQHRQYPICLLCVCDPQHHAAGHGLSTLHTASWAPRYSRYASGAPVSKNNSQ